MIDTLIIGGGAAGLYASSLLPDAVILERNESCGRKLLLTGGGRCNYTHLSPVNELLTHYHGSLPFIRKVLYSHTPEDIINHFGKLGIKPINEDGRIFPSSERAEDILAALLSHRPEILHGKAIAIEKRNDSFAIKTEETEIRARNIIIAAGGMAYPHTGSDGTGYHLLKALGHNITPPHPALAPLKLEPALESAEGVSTYITLQKGKKTVSGMAVITKKGISGPAAENFSYLLNGREEITISFAEPDLKALRETRGSVLLKNALSIPPRLTKAILGEISEKKIANLSAKEEREAFTSLSCGHYIASPIAQGAMSTAGGVKTEEIKADTMESKIIPGLYFTGDIIDVDADCGGYSLTWAFATAYIAARTIHTGVIQ